MARIGDTRDVCVAIMVYIWTIAFHDCDTEGGWDQASSKTQQLLGVSLGVDRSSRRGGERHATIRGTVVKSSRWQSRQRPVTLSQECNFRLRESEVIK